MNFILFIARMVIPHLMLDLKNKNLKTQTGWNFIPFTIRHLLSMVSCERNGRQQTTHPPERTQNRPWNKFHRRTFTVSPLVINLLRWKMNAMPPLCWNTGQHTLTTQRNVRETCVKNVCFTTSSWQSAAYTDREGMKLTIEKTSSMGVKLRWNGYFL